jgi:hypothetical protein
MLPYGYEHFVKLEPSGRFLDPEIAKTPQVCFLNEVLSQSRRL